MKDYLYKGLNPEEIKLGQLIPKEQGEFLQHPRLPLYLPFSLGKNRENAAINHQKGTINKKTREYDYKTPGVSTTTDLNIAIKYATNDGKKEGAVAYIMRNKLPEYEIKEYNVSKCPERIKPEDKEIILYDDIGKPMPKEIIDKIEPITNYFT